MLRILLAIPIAFLLFGFARAQSDRTLPRDDAGFQSRVLPILQSRCFGCHGPDEQNGDVRLDTLSTDLVQDRTGADTWHDVLDAVQLGEMPPEDADSITPKQRRALVDWIRSELTRAERARRSTGGQVAMRRLNRVEYQNTMRDLLGIELDYARDLPPDPISSDGFQNNGYALKMSAMQLESYLAAARRGLETAIVDQTEPVAHSHQADESVKDKGKGNWTTRLGRTGQFVARVDKFPDQGRFGIRVQAHAESPAGSDYPIMEVSLGFRADVSAPSRVVGTVDVSNQEPQVFQFSGRLEEFPIQSRTQSKYPGMLIWARNVYDDGKPAPKPNKKNRKNKKPVYEEDPTFPKVIIDSIEFEAPVFSQWPPAYHTRLIAEMPSTPEQELEAARRSLKPFLRRAFRRDVIAKDVDRFLRYFEAVRPDSESFLVAMREVMSMALVSPEFLYLSEPQADGRDLSDHELAARLSYFLWSTMPDDRLLDLASEQKLSGPDALKREVKRMLADTRSEQFCKQFTEQWLDLAAIDRIAVNPEWYPDFDLSLKQDMRLEPSRFFAELMRNDLSALNLIDSRFVVVNQRLADHYGIDGPRGSRFERVELSDDSERGGLLTQAAVLLSNSTGEDSHPIKRAVWIRDRLLNDPPAPPPPDVPDLNQELPDLAALPLKLQLEQHRENATCANCHTSLDPWGVTLESFDAIGKVRESIRRPHPKRRGTFVEHPVDNQAELPDGTTISGAEQLKAYLISHRNREFARAFVGKLLSYATGRTLELGDQDVIDQLTDQFIDADYNIKRLIQQIVVCESFRQG